jgi:hypothetical protein
MVHFDSFRGAPPFTQFAFVNTRLWMRTCLARPLGAALAILSEKTHPWWPSLLLVSALLFF